MGRVMTALNVKRASKRLTDAACANVDAWRRVASAEAVQCDGNLMLESVRRRDLYAAKAAAQQACIELQDAVDAFRKAGAQ